MYKLLIADDEAEIRNGLCRFFPWQSVGFEVVGSVGNGVEAYDFIRENAVHILLCDIVMPVLNGLELARRLHGEKSPVRIVFMSAYTDFQYARQALECGVMSYILKSTHFDDLIDVFTRIRSEMDDEAKLGTGAESALTYGERVVIQIKQYVEENYAQASIERMARVVHMNADYVSKFFKKNAGETFSEYLLKVRMKRAAALLRDPLNKIGDVGEMVGFSNHGNFTRAFRNFYGRSPREYRLLMHLSP